jgi:WD40 repeat protein
VDGPLLVDATSAAFILPPDNGPALVLKNEDGTGIKLARMDRNGQRAFTSGWRRVANLWDARSGGQIAALGHDARVNAVAFSEDGSRLATETEDGKVTLWDAASGKRLAFFSVGKSATCVSFSQDGTLLAASGENGEVRVWDLRTEAKIQVWTLDSPVWEVVFDRDGKSLLIADDSKVLRRVDLTTGRELARRSFSGNVSSIASDSASGLLAVGVRRTDDDRFSRVRRPVGYLWPGSHIARLGRCYPDASSGDAPSVGVPCSARTGTVNS